MHRGDIVFFFPTCSQSNRIIYSLIYILFSILSILKRIRTLEGRAARENVRCVHVYVCMCVWACVCVRHPSILFKAVVVVGGGAGDIVGGDI